MVASSVNADSEWNIIVWSLVFETFKSPTIPPRRHRSSKKLRMAQLMLRLWQSLKNVMEPPCCRSAYCRRCGTIYSSTSACPRSSRCPSCSAHPHSSIGSATWGTKLAQIHVCVLQRGKTVSFQTEAASQLKDLCSNLFASICTCTAEGHWERF